MKDKELSPEAKAKIIGQIRTLLEQYVEHGISVNFVNDITCIGARGTGDYTADIELGWAYTEIRDKLKINLNSYLDTIPDKEKKELVKYYESLKKNKFMIPKEDRIYVKKWFYDPKTLYSGDVLVFEMPSFCSGDYSAQVFFDEDGDPYIHKDYNFYDGCRNFYIMKNDEVDQNLNQKNSEELKETVESKNLFTEKEMRDAFIRGFEYYGDLWSKNIYEAEFHNANLFFNDWIKGKIKK